LKSHLEKRTQAWTLIELIGALSVVAFLSAAVVPLVVRRVDKAVADQELAVLKTLANGFEQYVVSTRVVPDDTTWYSAIAAQLGFGTNDVLYNPRQLSHQRTRVFLIDPALQVGLGSSPSGLPYVQANFVTSTSSPMMPTNPRMMIVSSLGKPLPGALVSGVFGTVGNGYFADLWNAIDGTIPNDAVWTGWTGDPADVFVQRINLTPLFFHVVLGRYNSANDGYYAVDPIPAVTSPTLATTVDGYFLRGSVLTLYTNSSAAGMDTKLILNADTSFVFEAGVWRSSILGSSFSGSYGVGDLVQQFIQATPNVNATTKVPANNQQILVANDMLKYMSNYNVWAYSNNYSKSSAAYSTLTALQPIMISDIQGLYRISTGNYPTNPGPCNN
jgi:type II secretory pathway pseudopilin PulG